jgi:D-proline reductase (dithiol) PrdB
MTDVPSDAKQTADAVLRRSMAEQPLPPLPDPTAFTVPPELSGARVAIVTTAGLMRPGEAVWTHSDSSFRAFGQDERELMVGHVSMNFDRAGATVDPNVVFPRDRLAELAADGVIGSVAERHLSFMGAGIRGREEVSTLFLDSGPAAAATLRADGVDVVVLTPVCPACSTTVTLLGHVLEAQGLSTIVLASNLRITERAHPPRALYCDFPLGRPLGRPLDPPFQRSVLEAAFALLRVERGPVLEVFPDVIADEADTPMACVLPPRYDPAVHPAVDEARGLRPAWERASREYGTQVGRRVGPDDITTSIASFLDIAAQTPWGDRFADEDEMLQTAMDIRMYYEQAALGLSEHVPAARATEAWFYQSTETGKLLREVVAVLRSSDQERGLSPNGLYYIVPLSQFDADDRVNPPWAPTEQETP